GSSAVRSSGMTTSRINASVRSRSATSSGERVKSITANTSWCWRRFRRSARHDSRPPRLHGSATTRLSVLSLTAQLFAESLAYRLWVLARIDVCLSHSLFHQLVADSYLSHNANMAEATLSSWRLWWIAYWRGRACLRSVARSLV